MNRIILIGNGFDLAHRMKTSYNHFLEDYWKNTIEEIINTAVNHPYENEEIIINRSPSKFIKGKTYSDLKNIMDEFDGIQFKNRFLEKITETSRLNSWVDIENEYYSDLKFTYSDKNSKYNNFDIDKLNNDFDRIKILLVNYLLKVSKEFNKEFNDNKLKQNIGHKIYSNFKYQDFTEKAIIEKVNYEYNRIKNNLEAIKKEAISFDEISEKDRDLIQRIGFKQPKKEIKKILLSENAINYFDLVPNQTLFLNFNYTYNELRYKNPNEFDAYDFDKITETKFIHIHGSLFETYKNPVIFGFGDELDENYKQIEKLNDNRYLENIKSIKYLETDNYKKLLEFLNSENYQIFIFGHSCGISDRTLLNTLFENKNCVSIKPFYHKKTDTDNYSDIIRNISRNFNEKATMRDKVVNKKYSEPLV